MQMALHHHGTAAMVLHMAQRHAHTYLLKLMLLPPVCHVAALCGLTLAELECCFPS